MKYFIWLLIFVFFASSFAFGQEESFTYDDKGKRDPFLALVDESGRYLLDIELADSSDVLKLSGILWDSQGKSSCLINDQIVKIGESISGFTIKNITKASVTISKNDQDFILRLSIEEKE